MSSHPLTAFNISRQIQDKYRDHNILLEPSPPLVEIAPDCSPTAADLHQRWIVSATALLRREHLRR
jgi:hypothetical protein